MHAILHHQADGIGLGLALARELVEAHGGQIVRSTAERGTVFTLPRLA